MTTIGLVSGRPMTNTLCTTSDVQRSRSRNVDRDLRKNICVCPSAPNRHGTVRVRQEVKKSPKVPDHNCCAKKWLVTLALRASAAGRAGPTRRQDCRHTEYRTDESAIRHFGPAGFGSSAVRMLTLLPPPAPVAPTSTRRPVDSYSAVPAGARWIRNWECDPRPDSRLNVFLRLAARSRSEPPAR